MIIAVTGMAREARLIAQTGVLSVVGGGDIDALEKRIDAAVAKGGCRVLSIGICGALCPELKVGDVVIASEIVTPDAVYTTNASWTRELAARIPHAFVAPMARKTKCRSTKCAGVTLPLCGLANAYPWMAGSWRA